METELVKTVASVQREQYVVRVASSTVIGATTPKWGWMSITLPFLLPSIFILPSLFSRRCFIHYSMHAFSSAAVGG